MSEPVVLIVDDDAAVRDALALLLGLRGYRTLVFADAESFLRALQPHWHGCLLLDIRMPGMDGLTLQQHLRDSRCPLPVVVMTGHGDAQSAREAFRAQAVDFIEKPLDHAQLFAAIEEAFSIEALRASTRDRRADVARRLTQLTPRESEVFALVTTGMHNRDVAQRLDISTRTVEVHKARILQKLGVSNVPQLVRLAIEAQSGA